MKTRLSFAGLIVATALALALLVSSGNAPSEAGTQDPYEVWALDQTGTRGVPNVDDYGGLLHIYGGPSLVASPGSAVAETIDLGGQVSDVCLEKTGARPRRPHMLAFNGGDRLGVEQGRFAIIAWVVSGHVTIHDARTRELLECIRTTAGAGGARQAHAAWPTADGRYLIVANQNGKKVERIRTDWANRQFTHETDASLDLYSADPLDPALTPNGELRQDPYDAVENPDPKRPDNAPICIRGTEDNRFAFVSLRGGGMFVIDHKATPIKIIAEYDRAHVKDNGCGQIEPTFGGKVFFNAGAGASVPALPTEADDPSNHALYALNVSDINPAGNPPNQPAPRVVYDRTGLADGHGVALVRGQTQVLSVDRERNDISVVDLGGEQLLERFSLEGVHSDDPAPDLVATSPDGQHVFTTLRGPAPLSGGHTAIGNSPGVGVIRLDEDGPGGRLAGIAPARRGDDEPPDPHGLNVRVNFIPTGQSLPLTSKLTVKGVHRFAGVRRNGLPLRFTLNQGATVRVGLRIRPKTARKLKLPARIAQARLTVPRAGDATVRLRLTARAVRLLSRHRRVHVTLNTTVDSGLGPAIRDNRKLLLRR